jgi:transposase
MRTHRRLWDTYRFPGFWPNPKVALGFVEGVNNKIRVIQRRSYGLRDEEYLRLKVLTCMLDPI